MVLFIALFLFLAPHSWAGEWPENSAMHTFPFPTRDLKETPVFKKFQADDGTELSYSILQENTKNNRPVVFLEGKGESVYRYLEFAKEMEARGYGPFYVLDLRGQGYSTRKIPLAIDVDTFDTYVDDFFQFMDKPVAEDLLRRGIRTKPFLMAHSMGGAIAELALRKRPDLVSRVAYVTPMFEIKFSAWMDRMHNDPIVYASRAMRKIGMGGRLFGGDVNSVPKVMISSDRARILTAYGIEVEKGIRTPKASVSWLTSALNAQRTILGPGKPEIPAVIFQGQYDAVISNAALNEYACAAGNCSLIELPGAHALHQERDPVRYKYEELLDEFFRGNEIATEGPCENFYKVLKHKAS